MVQGSEHMGGTMANAIKKGEALLGGVGTHCMRLIGMQ